MTQTNWLFLSKVKVWINMNNVTEVYDGKDLRVYFINQADVSVFQNDDAEKIREYLNRIAYA